MPTPTADRNTRSRTVADVEETAVAQALVDQFKATLSEKDMQILELRMNGDTLEEIAEKAGLQKSQRRS